MNKTQINQPSQTLKTQIVLKKILQIILYFCGYSFGLFFLVGFLVYFKVSLLTSFLFLVGSFLSFPFIHTQINKITHKKISGFAYLPIIFVSIIAAAVNSPKLEPNKISNSQETNSQFSKTSQNSSEVQNLVVQNQAISSEVNSAFSLSQELVSQISISFSTSQNSQISQTQLPQSNSQIQIQKIEKSLKNDENQANPNIITAPKFGNCTQAKAAGYGGMNKGTPAYNNNPELDRDKDGIACDK